MFFKDGFTVADQKQYQVSKHCEVCRWSFDYLHLRYIATMKGVYTVSLYLKSVYSYSLSTVPVWPAGLFYFAFNIFVDRPYIFLLD